MPKKKNNLPLISIIVPVYNVEKYISFCIDSILNQKYSNIEVILVDDGSTDNSGRICDSYIKKDSRVSVIHKKNGGVSDARNVGIANSHGDYIGFVDSDDWIHPEFYNYLYKLIKNYNSDIAICDFKRKNKEEIDFDNFENKKIIVYNKDEYLKKYFKIGSQDTEYYPWNKLYKKNIIEKDQFPFGISCGEDVLGTYKSILKSNKIVKGSNKYYYYRETVDSVTRKFSDKDFDIIKVWDMMIEYSHKIAPKYDYYVKINRDRTDFTILYRLASNYNTKELKKMKIVYELIDRLKNNEKELLHSNISFSRKIVIYLFCKNYFFFSKFF